MGKKNDNNNNNNKPAPAPAPKPAPAPAPKPAPMSSFEQKAVTAVAQASQYFNAVQGFGKASFGLPSIPSGPWQPGKPVTISQPANSNIQATLQQQAQAVRSGTGAKASGAMPYLFNLSPYGK
jgi:hypothetical protein